MSEKEDKRRKEYLARKERLAKAEAARAERHVLYVNGDRSQPIFVTASMPAGAKITLDATLAPTPSHKSLGNMPQRESDSGIDLHTPAQ